MLSASAPGYGQEHLQTVRKTAVTGGHAAPRVAVRSISASLPKAATGMQVTNWLDLGSKANASAPSVGLRHQIDMAPPPPSSEEITVYGQTHNRDVDWRADIEARQPVYEATNSDATKSLIPYPEYISPEQERLMSIKTDALGLCGALGGYIQCPNKQP